MEKIPVTQNYGTDDFESFIKDLALKMVKKIKLHPIEDGDDYIRSKSEIEESNRLITLKYQGKHGPLKSITKTVRPKREKKEKRSFEKEIEEFNKIKEETNLKKGRINAYTRKDDSFKYKSRDNNKMRNNDNPRDNYKMRDTAKEKDFKSKDNKRNENNFIKKRNEEGKNKKEKNFNKKKSKNFDKSKRNFDMSKERNQTKKNGREYKKTEKKIIN